MGIAHAVREGADCLGTLVGAVVVLGNRVVSTGYNGTPEGFLNCKAGGCVRCTNRMLEKTGRHAEMTDPAHVAGRSLDHCICVHAEQNAFITAARHGIRLEGATRLLDVEPVLRLPEGGRPGRHPPHRLRHVVPRRLRGRPRRPVSPPVRAPRRRRPARLRGDRRRTPADRGRPPTRGVTSQPPLAPSGSGYTSMASPAPSTSRHPRSHARPSSRAIRPRRRRCELGRRDRRHGDRHVGRAGGVAVARHR